MGGIVGISVEVTVGGIFSFSAMAVGGGNSYQIKFCLVYSRKIYTTL